METVTQIRPKATQVPVFRTLAYRYHEPRPRAGDGIAFVEFCIEQQLSAVLDERPVDEALALLAEWNVAIDTATVERLLDLAGEVYDAEVNDPAERFYAAVDEYAGALRALAVKVRAS